MTLSSPRGVCSTTLSTLSPTPTQVRFDAFVAEGRVLNNYAHVLAMLQQLRQACDHPFLVLAR